MDKTRTLTVMGILAWLTSRFRPPSPNLEGLESIVVDLSRFSCGATALGEVPRAEDPFCEPLARKDSFKSERHGFTIETRGGKLDCIVLDLRSFPGRFRYQGNPLRLDGSSTIEEVLRVFGEPYWRDEDDEEVLLFYEDGRVELQFEFPGKKTLRYLTMMLDPILADAEQRRLYRVTKPWPPPAATVQ